MKPIFTKIFLIVCILSLSGCMASKEKYHETLNGWINYSARELVTLWGAPYDTYKIANHEELLVYVSINRRFVPKGAIIPIQNGRYCKTTFFIQNGNIVKWSTEGPCKSP